VSCISQNAQEKVSDSLVFVHLSDIDSANVAFLLLDQCKLDRLILTKGISDASEAIKEQKKVIGIAREDSLLQAEMISVYIKQVNATELLYKKEARRSKVKSILHYSIDGALFAALLYSVFSK
jgi:hypothetical protein